MFLYFTIKGLWLNLEVTKSANLSVQGASGILLSLCLQHLDYRSMLLDWTLCVWGGRGGSDLGPHDNMASILPDRSFPWPLLLILQDHKWASGLLENNDRFDLHIIVNRIVSD